MGATLEGKFLNEGTGHLIVGGRGNRELEFCKLCQPKKHEDKMTRPEWCGFGMHCCA